MPENPIPRRNFLRRGLAASAALGAGLTYAALPPGLLAAAATPAACGTLQDIQHVVIFIQENRSFDNYFGTYRGVRGFKDPNALVQPNGKSVFSQNDPSNANNPPIGTMLPFHLDIATTNAACTHDLTHDWVPQHQSWNGGRMDSFVRAHLSADPTYGNLTMGYYTRSDLPYLYAVADAFTVCDNYHCSLLGPTDPNRLMSMTATVDPDGRNGGPLLQTLSGSARGQMAGKFTWRTMPEQLEAAGIPWKVYAPANSGNDVLPFFAAYQDSTTDLYKRAFTPRFPATFQTDCQSGKLPAVSWVIANQLASEHPPGPSVFGAEALDQVLQAVTGNAALWAKTAIFVTYDENGGFFDHVPPPFSPPNTPGEWVTAPPVPDPTVLGNPPINGPIGLGFRVPMLIVSPFSRGGFVCSDVFDHTSILRFLERRFGTPVPNLSAWRRAAVGDLTSALNFAAPNPALPTLPPANTLQGKSLQECVASLIGETPYPTPNPQVAPTQASGTAPKPSGPC